MLNFANDLLLAIYLIFILGYGYDVRQKANLSDFFYLSSKWVLKQWRQLAVSTVHLAQELLIYIQYSGGSRKFAKATRDLKMRSVVATIES